MTSHMRGVDPSLRAKVREELIRDYGDHTILAGNRMPPVRRLPTRSLAIDYILGGGFPFGMMTRFWGGYSTGKSTMIFNAFWSAQNFGLLRFVRLSYLASIARMAGDTKDAKKLSEQAKREQDQYVDGLKCFYVCTEKVFDQKLAESLGVKLDEDHFEITFTRRIEQIGETVSKALLAYHVIAIDSTTGTASVDEYGHADGIYGESQTTGMTRARKWGYNMDWWQDRISHENVLIFTSQIQAMIGMSAQARIQAEKAPGGHKLDHEPAAILHFMRGGWLKRKANGAGLEPVGDTGGDKGAFGRAQAAGSELVVRCDKNKTGRSHRIVLMHHDKRKAAFDSLWEYEKFAKYFKVVEVNGSWITLPDGRKTQSLRTELEENPTLMREIEDVVLRCAADPAYEDRLLRDGPGEELVPQLSIVA